MPLTSDTIHWTLVFAAIAGFTAVACGAFGAHGLKSVLSADMMNVYQTGVMYHLVHAVVLLALALFLINNQHNLLSVAAICMALGIVLFSGSLYALAITEIRWLGAITPIGGVIWLVGWGMILWASVRWPST